MSTVETYVDRVMGHVPRALPERSRIELEVRAHLTESLEAGRSEAEAVNHMGPPEEVARSFLAEVEMPLAGLGRRAAAFLIDMTLGLAVLAPAVLLPLAAGPGLEALAAMGPAGEAADVAQLLWPAIFVVLLLTTIVGSFLYFPVLEHLYGQTLGKWLLGIAVVRESGLRVGLLPAVVRRLPLFFEFFWLDALFAPFSEKRQRAFDMVAKTVVVDVSEPSGFAGGPEPGRERPQPASPSSIR